VTVGGPRTSGQARGPACVRNSEGRPAIPYATDPPGRGWGWTGRSAAPHPSVRPVRPPRVTLTEVRVRGQPLRQVRFVPCPRPGLCAGRTWVQMTATSLADRGRARWSLHGRSAGLIAVRRRSKRWSDFDGGGRSLWSGRRRQDEVRHRPPGRLTFREVHAGGGTTTSGRRADGGIRWPVRDRDRVAVVARAAPPSASTGPLHRRLLVAAVTSAWPAAVDVGRDRRPMAGDTMTSGMSGADLSRPLDHRTTSRAPGWRNFCATGSEAFRNACYALPPRLRHAMAVARGRRSRDTGIRDGPPAVAFDAHLGGPHVDRTRRVLPASPRLLREVRGTRRDARGQ